MLKKVFLVFLFFVFMLIVSVICIRSYRNHPTHILKEVQDKIVLTRSSEFDSFKDWVWEADRTFIFDIFYMNLFSPGSAKMHVAGETKLKGDTAIVLEAALEPNETFKKIYNAKMIINAAAEKNSRESLWYREITITPEKEKSKEIVFDPVRKLAMREGMKYKIPDNTHDPLSVFFAFLSSDFVLGKEIVLNLLSKEEIYEFRATPEELRDNIYKISGEVHRQDKSSAHGARFKMWVLNGKTRVPLLIKASTAVGPIYLRLRSVK